MIRRILYVVGGVVIIYLLGVLLFWSRFVPGTTVNGIPVGFLTRGDAFVNAVSQTKQQTLTFLRRDGFSEILTYEDLGVIRVSDAQILEIQRSPWLWFLDFGKAYDFPETYDYDEDTVYQAMLGLDCVSSEYQVDPQDAHIGLLSDGSVRFFPATNGSVIEKDRLLTCILESLSSHTDVLDLEALGCYQEIDLSARDQDMKLDSNVSFSSFMLDMGADVVEEIPESVLDSFVEETEDGQVLRYSLVYSYVQSLAVKYDTWNQTQKFKTIDGKILTLSHTENDTYLGWKLDVDQTANQLCSDLLSKKTSGTALWLGKGMVHEKQDIGDTYVELSIAKQHLWYVKDGEVVLDTDVITGLDSDAKRRTPTGMFKTMDFYEDYTMHGDDYTAFSEYFIRLTPNGIGIHDASWKSEFGGGLYKTEGSHGCINTPYEKVKVLYQELQQYWPQSIPVIIY